MRRLQAKRKQLREYFPKQDKDRLYILEKEVDRIMMMDEKELCKKYGTIKIEQTTLF